MATQTTPSEEQALIDRFSSQKSVFSIITLFVLALLLMLHGVLASIQSEPSLPIFTLLATALALTVAELLWLHGKGRELTDRAARIESCISIGAIFVLTALLTYFTNHDENPYFVLLTIPILQCAYMFSLFLTILTIAAADAMILFWIWHFYVLHPPARITEYLEIGMLCAIYFLMGLLVWFLVNQLKANQSKLTNSLELLQTTRERLDSEEKLAAVGRLASGVAHEIRNPVAMISSSLAIANYPGTEDGEREAMFAIAARESKRLESLTADFLMYARPSPLRPTPVLINDLLTYIASVARTRAASRFITIESLLGDDVRLEIDIPQMESALLNLVMNAIDATPPEGTIKLRSVLQESGICIDIEDSGPPISDSDLAQIFEPFFTTKPAGTGLGLAIARGAARAHGGDLCLSENREGCVRFSMTLIDPTTNDIREGATHV